MDGKRFACCCGQNAYDFCEPLEKAVNDSSSMAALLAQNGFAVTSANNTTKKAMKAAIRNFRQLLVPNSAAVFYFSGYAVQQDGLNYLVPKDADCVMACDIEDDCVSLNWIIQGIMECGTTMAAIFIEGARGHPFQPKWASPTIPVNKGLASMKPPPGILIAFSAEPNSTMSFEYTLEAHSVFTQALLDCIGVPDLSLVDAMKDVRNQVLSATEDCQRVWVQARQVDELHIGPRTSSSARPGSAAGSYEIVSSRDAPRSVSKNSARGSSPLINTTTLWSFVNIPHNTSWRNPILTSKGKLDGDGNPVYDECAHPSASVDSNVVVGLDPPFSSGKYSVTLRFQRPPEETESAHSVELVSVASLYTNETKSLTFELPNVMHCEARFDVDFQRDTMTMFTNDGQDPVSLPISDLAAVGEAPPYRLVIYMWDAGSKCFIVQ